MTEKVYLHFVERDSEFEEPVLKKEFYLHFVERDSEFEELVFKKGCLGGRRGQMSTKTQS